MYMFLDFFRVQLMASIIEELLGENLPSSLDAQLELTKQYFDWEEEKEFDDDDLYLIIYGFEHLLSSDSKQKSNFRRALLSLARMAGIHIIAVADHIMSDACEKHDARFIIIGTINMKMVVIFPRSFVL